MSKLILRNSEGEIINNAMRWTNCPVCEGNGFVDMTNEEWRKTCSAEEFAKWLEEICFREQYNDGESMSGWYEEHDEKYWKKWLKQPHREIK